MAINAPSLAVMAYREERARRDGRPSAFDLEVMQQEKMVERGIAAIAKRNHENIVKAAQEAAATGTGVYSISWEPGKDISIKHVDAASWCQRRCLCCGMLESEIQHDA